MVSRSIWSIWMLFPFNRMYWRMTVWPSVKPCLRFSALVLNIWNKHLIFQDYQMSHSVPQHWAEVDSPLSAFWKGFQLTSSFLICKILICVSNLDIYLNVHLLRQFVFCCGFWAVERELIVEFLIIYCDEIYYYYSIWLLGMFNNVCLVFIAAICYLDVPL